MTSADTDLGFPTKGSLKRVPFSTLLRDIAGAGVTGSLYLMSGDTKKVVFFVDGRPTVVRSNLAAEFLGQILTDQGLITQEQCDNTLEAIRRTGKKQGELLVEMGILSESNLRYGLEEQLRRKLFEIFDWEEGRFQFKAGAEPGLTGAPPAGTTEALILAAIQQRYTDERAREALRPFADRYPTQSARWSGDPAGLELLPEELYFLRCIDGSRTTDELLSRKPDLEVPRLSTLLLGLVSAGVVEPLETKSPRRLAPLRPNLSPPTLPEEQLAPGFEVLSTIGEYEDTPLPSRLPTDLGASSSKNPRVPILPTEDEEMFRGLDVDESIVTDSRSLRAKLQAAAGREVARPAPAPAPTPTPAPAAPEPPGGFDDETDFSDLHGVGEPAAPAPAPAQQDSGKHRLGPAPGLDSLLRKEPTRPVVAAAPRTIPEPVVEPPVSEPPVTAEPELAPDASLASAAIALLDEPELPDDLPDPDDLLGDEPLEDIEEFEELDDEMIEDDLEDDLDGDAADEPAAAAPEPAAAAPELAAAVETDDPLAELAAAAGTDDPLADLAAAAGTDDPFADLAGLAAEPPPTLAPVSVAPAEPEAPLVGDLPQEPAELGGLGDLGDLGDLPGDSGLAPIVADDGPDLADADALLADVDDDLLLGDLDAGDLPDLDDLDGLDLGDDLGDLAGDLGEGLGDDDPDLGGFAPGPDESSVSIELSADLSADIRAAGFGDPDLAGDLAGDVPDLGDPDLSGDLAGDVPDLGDPNLSGDLSADLDADAEELDPLDEEPDLGDLGDDLGYADEPALASGESTYVGPGDASGGDAGAAGYAAVRYAEAEAAMQEGDYDTAVALFEDAYNTGYDSANLHAHLAFARFRASGGDPEIGQNSLELLDYAEGMNPGLAILHAYRGAILVGLGAADGARECFERALYLDPYCELALEYREAE